MINQIEEETGSLPPNLPRGVTPEVAAENQDVQAIIAPRLTMLMEIANSFLLTIIDSMESVPYGIRWICKQIRSLTRVRSMINSPLLLDLLTMPSRESTLKRQITPSAPLLVAFSSSGSLIRRSSRLKHTCLSKASRRSIRDGH